MTGRVTTLGISALSEAGQLVQALGHPLLRARYDARTLRRPGSAYAALAAFGPIEREIRRGESMPLLYRVEVRLSLDPDTPVVAEALSLHAATLRALIDCERWVDAQLRRTGAR